MSELLSFFQHPRNIRFYDANVPSFPTLFSFSVLLSYQSDPFRSVPFGPILGASNRQTLPLAGRVCFLFQQSIKVGGIAAIFPPAPFLLQETGLTQVAQRALHCGARQTKIRCDGLDRRPAAAFCVGAILEIHVHCSRAMVQVRRIDRIVNAFHVNIHCLMQRDCSCNPSKSSRKACPNF